MPNPKQQGLKLEVAFGSRYSVLASMPNPEQQGLKHVLVLCRLRRIRNFNFNFNFKL